MLEQYLRVFCNAEQLDWASHLALAQFTYNTSVHATTRYAPSTLLLGYTPRVALDEGGFREVLATPAGTAPKAISRVRLLQGHRDAAVAILKDA